jgi:peptidoglycan hydrolase-like amidase
MCQMGAIDIAHHGYNARIILGHYFPDTTIEALPTSGSTAAQAVTAHRALAANAGTGGRATQ